MSGEAGGEMSEGAIVIFGKPDAFRSGVSSEVNEIMDQICTLAAFSSSDLERIRPSLYDAVRAYTTTKWLKIVWKTPDLGLIPLMMPVMTFFIATIAAAVLLPGSPMTNPRVTIYLAPLLVIVLLIRSGLHIRIRPRLIGVFIACELLVAVAALTTSREWSKQVDSYWASAVRALLSYKFADRHHVATVPAAEILMLALWILALASILSIMVRLISWGGMVIASDLPLGYSRSARLNSQLIVALFEIAHKADSLHTDLTGIGAADTGYRFLWTQKDRRKIDSALDKAARLVRSPWADIMGSTNGTAGRWIAAQAPRIEFFLRYQQSKNIFTGANLIDLRDSMISAAVQALEGDWQSIGSDQADALAALKARQWRLTMRRIAAICIPWAIVGIVAAFTPHTLSAYRNLIIVTCVGYSAVQLLSLIDPDFSERIDLASRAAASFIKRR
jgi:hypothetical protein